MLNKLKKSTSSTTNRLCSLGTASPILVPIILSQNADNLQPDSPPPNPLHLDDRQLETKMVEMARMADKNQVLPLLSVFIDILKLIEGEAKGHKETNGNNAKIQAMQEEEEDEGMQEEGDEGMQEEERNEEERPKEEDRPKE